MESRPDEGVLDYAKRVAEESTRRNMAHRTKLYQQKDTRS